MERPTDLLVEQHLAHESVDPVVQPDRPLSDIARTGIGLQHLLEVGLIALGARLDDTPALEAQLDPLHSAIHIHRRKAEPNPALHRVLNRPGEHLAGGHVPMTVVVDERAPGDREAQIDVWPLDFDVRPPGEPVDQPLLAGGDLPPARRGIVDVGETRREHKVLQRGQAHLRFLSVGRRRVEGNHPAQVSSRTPAQEGLVQRGAGGGAPPTAIRINAAQGARVGTAPHDDQALKLAPHQLLGPEHVIELILAGLLEEDFAQALHPDIGLQPHEDVGVGACLQQLSVDLTDQRRGGGRAIDGDVLFRLGFDRVGDQRVGESGQARVG